MGVAWLSRTRRLAVGPGQSHSARKLLDREPLVIKIRDIDSKPQAKSKKY